MRWSRCRDALRRVCQDSEINPAASSDHCLGQAFPSQLSYSSSSGVGGLGEVRRRAGARTAWKQLLLPSWGGNGGLVFLAFSTWTLWGLSALVFLFSWGFLLFVFDSKLRLMGAVPLCRSDLGQLTLQDEPQCVCRLTVYVSENRATDPKNAYGHCVSFHSLSKLVVLLLFFSFFFPQMVRKYLG